jgi:hypothetical protein
MGVIAERNLRLELANGSRVISLPGDEKNVRARGATSGLATTATRTASRHY